MAQDFTQGLISGPSTADLRRRRRENFMNQALAAGQGGAGSRLGAGLATLATGLMGGPADTQQINEAEKMSRARKQIQQELGGIQNIIGDSEKVRRAQQILVEQGRSDAAQRLPVEVAQVQQAQMKPQSMRAEKELTEAQTKKINEEIKQLGRSKGLEVKSQFGAVNKDTGERFTALRTDKGLFTQGVDEQGNPTLIPINSRKIQPVRTVEQGSSEDVGLGSTEQRGLRDREVAVKDFVKTAKDAVEMLDKYPDINTFTAQASSFINDMRQEAKAMGEQLGLDFERDSLKPNTYKDTFEELGIQNARMKSLLTSLSFKAASASGQTGRSVSDRDVERFLKMVGGSSSDPKAMARTLKDLVDRQTRQFKMDYRTRKNQDYEGDLGLEDFPSFEPEQPSQEESSQQQDSAPETEATPGLTPEEERRLQQLEEQ